MLSHQSVCRSLDAYVGGSLSDSRRAEVDAHLQTCAECGKSLQQIHRLDFILDDLPPAPLVPFSPFWSRLRARLPDHGEKRVPFYRPGRLAAAFALALLASVVGVVALASDAVMPDSPLYALKHGRQEVQLALAGSRERPGLELVLGKQRLHEALLMLQRKRPDLALASLRDFHALLVDVSSRLEEAPGGQPGTTASSVAELETELQAVRNASIGQEGSTAVDTSALDGAVHADLNAVNQVETRVDQGGTMAGDSPSTSAAPSPSAESSPPAESSPFAQPGASSPPEATQPTAAPSPSPDTTSPSPSD